MAGTSVNTKNILVNWKCPSGVENAVFSLSTLFTPNCQLPRTRSKYVKKIAPERASSTSSHLGKGCIRPCLPLGLTYDNPSKTLTSLRASSLCWHGSLRTYTLIGLASPVSMKCCLVFSSPRSDFPLQIAPLCRLTMLHTISFCSIEKDGLSILNKSVIYFILPLLYSRPVDVYEVALLPFASLFPFVVFFRCLSPRQMC